MKLHFNSEGGSYIESEVIAQAAIHSCFELLINIGFDHSEISEFFLIASQEISDEAEQVNLMRDELIEKNEIITSIEKFEKNQYSIIYEARNQVFLKSWKF